MNVAQSQPKILWKQVLGLTALQAGITLMWVIYRLYLPTLLGELGFAAQVGLVLLFVEEGLAVILQPIMGGLSDRTLRQVGTRFPVIALGVILASAFFISIPAFAVVGNPTAVLRGITLVVLVCWASSMVVFHSPTIALLNKYAAVSHLPLAASLLTLSSRLVGTAAPIINQFILGFGAAIAFAVGSIVLLGTSTVLRSIDPPSAPLVTEDAQIRPLTSISLLRIGVVGLCVGWGTRLIMDNFGKLYSGQFADLNTGRLMLGIAIGLAVLAVPAGWLAVKLGNRRVLCTAMLLAIVCAGAMVFLPILPVLIACTIALVVALSLIFNGVFPFALAQVPSDRGGLGIGMYLGGISAATFSFAWFFRQPEVITPAMGAAMAAIALLIAATCVVLSPRNDP